MYWFYNDVGVGFFCVSEVTLYSTEKMMRYSISREVSCRKFDVNYTLRVYNVDIKRQFSKL